jgi:excisionase family DNA binding protein
MSATHRPSGLTPLLTPSEVARVCGYSRKAIYAAIERGELRATKRCSRWRISEDDLKAWLDDGVPSAQSGPTPTQRKSLPRLPLPRGSFRALEASAREQER